MTVIADWQLNFTGNLAAQSKASTSAVDSLTAAILAEEKALKSLTVQATRAAVGSDAKKYDKASAAIKETNGKLSLLRGEAARLAQEKKVEQFYKGTVGPSINFAKATRTTTQRLREFAGTVKGAASTGFSKWAGLLKPTAAAAVVLAVAVASVVATVSTFGLAAGDAARSTRLLNQAADLAGGTHRQLDAVIRGIAEEVPIARAKLGEMARELRTLRFDSRQTQLAVSAMAFAESALGAGASAAVKGIAEASKATRRFTIGARDLYGEYQGLKGTGLSKADLFAALAKNLGTSVGGVEQLLRRGQISVRQGLEGVDAAMRKKFGSTIRAQLLSLPVQFNKFKEGIADLFGDINIEPFLEGIREVLSIFSQTTASGRAIKAFLTDAFAGLGEVAKAVFPMIKAFIFGLIVGALQIYVALRPIGREFAKLFKVKGDGLATAFNAGVIAMKVFAGVIATLGSLVIVTWSSIIGIVTVVGSVISAVTARVKGVVSTLKDYSWADIGIAIVKGLADGIKNGAGLLWDGIKFLGRGAVGLFKGIFQIGSPSKLFRQYGEWTVEGYEIGVRSEAPKAHAAVAEIGSATPMAMAQSGRQRAQGPSVTLNLTALGDEGVRRIIREEVPAMLREAFEGGPRPALV